MYSQIDVILEHSYAVAFANFSVAVLMLIVFLAVFELVTRYHAFAEIRKGNMAVALAVGGKIFGIANVFRFAIESHESVYSALYWASLGFVLLLLAYFIFEWLTPFRVDRELEQGNTAVGLICMMIAIALSFIVGASIP